MQRVDVFALKLFNMSKSGLSYSMCHNLNSSLGLKYASYCNLGNGNVLYQHKCFVELLNLILIFL